MADDPLPEKIAPIVAAAATGPHAFARDGEDYVAYVAAEGPTLERLLLELVADALG